MSRYGLWLAYLLLTRLQRSIKIDQLLISIYILVLNKFAASEPSYSITLRCLSTRTLSDQVLPITSEFWGGQTTTGRSECQYTNLELKNRRFFQFGNTPDYYKDNPKTAAHILSTLGRTASQKELINRHLKTMDSKLL